MAIIEVFPQSWGTRYWFYCEGCKGGHAFNCRTDGKHPSWSFNGNLERPTFSPSLLIQGVREITDDEHAKIMRGEHVEPKPYVCHSFVRDGQMEFLSDCTHQLAGQTVPLPNLDD